MDTPSVEADFVSRADAAEVCEFLGFENCTEVGVIYYVEAIGFVKGGGEFGEEAVGGDADVARHPFSYFGTDAVFDFLTYFS